jgi:hypothetical protein
MIERCRVFPAVLIIQMLSCSPVADRQKPGEVLAGKERTEIVLDSAVAAGLRTRAFRQGPITPPEVRDLPCRLQPDSSRQGSIVETIIDERGRVVWASVVAGEHGQEIDDAARRCLGAALFLPATMDGRPVPVYFSLALSLRR